MKFPPLPKQTAPFRSQIKHAPQQSYGVLIYFFIDSFTKRSLGEWPIEIQS